MTTTEPILTAPTTVIGFFEPLQVYNFDVSAGELSALPVSRVTLPSYPIRPGFGYFFIDYRLFEDHDVRPKIEALIDAKRKFDVQIKLHTRGGELYETWIIEEAWPTTYEYVPPTYDQNSVLTIRLAVAFDGASSVKRFKEQRQNA